jgi:meso-butanediol dehydrogenase/(S,S)-butanediol dehydrogenase/diacetyl reductase
MLLANSAGMRGVGNVLDTDPEDWRKVLSVNLEGTFQHVPGFRRCRKGKRDGGSTAGIRSH